MEAALVPTSYNIDRPWERQPCDTEKRWRAFKAYRDQRPPRTIRGAQEALRTGDEPISLRSLEVWTTGDAWPERCMAFDRWIDRQRVQATVDILNEDANTVAAGHIQILRNCRTAAASVAEGWLKKLAAGEELEGWTPNEVRQMIRDAITLERVIRGEATETIDHRVGVFDLTNLSLDEIREYKALAVKAGVPDV